MAVSVLVAVCSIAATAWLAARTATSAVQQAQGVALTDDARIYTTLLEYASTHPNWNGVGPTVQSLARQTGRRVALLTEDRRPIADSATVSAPLPSTTSTVVDPLNVNPALAPEDSADRIDPDAVGPFLLTSSERAGLQAQAQTVLQCVQARTGTGSITYAPNGRPQVVSDAGGVADGCGQSELARPTETEAAALADLNTLLNVCLSRQRLVSVQLNADLTWVPTGAAPAGNDQPIQNCLTSARSQQLGPYLSPAALLFVTTTNGAAPTAFSLSTDNEVRIAGVAAAVLLLALAVTALAAVKLITPLRALTGAAQRMREGDAAARVEVRGRDEIARLGAAFNDMSAHREHMEELRKAMVSDIAHELRTPLSNIRGWLEATEYGLIEPDPALNASLLEEAMLLQHIIGDLQDLATADAGMLRLHREPVRLADLLSHVCAAHRVRAESAGIALSTAVPDELELFADPVRLRQAVENLVTNALRHTPDGGSVRLGVGRTGDVVVIEVTDTGTGIGAEDLPHVFDRFWRAEKSRSRQAGGSGLGLAIVRKLAEAHGGTVTVASSPGQGSTFALRLPASPPSD